MAKDRMTPEEKLLQVIDNPASARRRSFAPFTRASALLATVTAWLGKWKALRTTAQPKLTLRTVNKGLVIVSGLLTTVWLVDFFSMRSELLTRLETVERTQLTAPAEATSKSGPPLEFEKLLEETKQRNIFTFLPPKAEAAPKAVLEELNNAVKELKLVGIIWSDNPQAMIEQTKEGRTHLVGAGELIGPLRVKKIFQDKVILGQAEGAEEWELR